MMQYVIVFCVVLILTYFSERNIKKGRKFISYFSSFISIFILSFFAAVRDNNVGKDIMIYVLPVFRWAQEFHLQEFLNIGTIETGYMFFVYIITMIFNNYNFILFFLQFIVASAIFNYAYKNYKDTSMILIIFSYLMLFYVDSFTMMRQYVAMAFILISINYFKNGKYFRTIIMYLLAISFHNAAVVSALMYFVIAMNSQKIFKNLNKCKKVLLFVVYVGFFVGICFYQKLIWILTYNIGILPSRYYEYILTTNDAGALSVSRSTLIFKCIWIIIGYYLTKFSKDDVSVKDAFTFLLFDFAIFIISFKLITLMRVGYYFSFVALLTIIPKASRIVKKDKDNQFLFGIILSIFLIYFWYFTFIKNGQNGGTYPYTSQILENLLK